MSILDVPVGTETSQYFLPGWGQTTYRYVWYSCNNSAFVYLTLHRNLIYFAFPVINYVYRNVQREFIIWLFSIQYRKGEKLTSSPFRHNNKHLVAHNRIQTNIVFLWRHQWNTLNFIWVICNAFKTTTKGQRKDWSHNIMQPLPELNHNVGILKKKIHMALPHVIFPHLCTAAHIGIGLNESAEPVNMHTDVSSLLSLTFPRRSRVGF